jgi:hypothetical protein
MTNAHERLAEALTDDAPISDEDVSDALERAARQLRVGGTILEQAWADGDYELAVTAALDVRAAAEATQQLMVHVVGHVKGLEPGSLEASLRRYVEATKELDVRVFDNEQVVDSMLREAAEHDRRFEAANAAREAAMTALRDAGFAVENDGDGLRVDGPPE